MQKQYFSHIRRQFVNVTGVLLASSIAIPALAAQGGFSAEKDPVATERMYAGHKVQQENSQSRIQAVSSMHEGAWITLEGNVISQQQEEWYTFRDPTGTIKVRIPEPVRVLRRSVQLARHGTPRCSLICEHCMRSTGARYCPG